MGDLIEFFLPGPSFSWREKVKSHKGPCPKRGHCTRTKTGQHPETKGNREQVIRIGTRSSIAPSSRTRAAEAALVVALRARPERPAEPWGGDLSLSVVFVFVPPTGWPKWKRAAALEGLLRPTGHNIGDRGQYLKMIEDALEKAGYYTDDCRVVCGDASKAWGPVPGYGISLEEMKPGPRTAAEAKTWQG